jgi:hypothetical protein
MIVIMPWAGPPFLGGAVEEHHAINRPSKGNKIMDAIVTAGGIPLPEDPLYLYTQGHSKAML